jgi:hypothetical protein
MKMTLFEFLNIKSKPNKGKFHRGKGKLQVDQEKSRTSNK